MILFLGVEGELDMPDRTFISTGKPRRVRTGDTYLELKHLTVNLLSRQDPSLAPPGCHILNVWAAVPDRCYPSFAGEASRRSLEEAVALAVKQELRRIIPQLDRRVVFQERVSPFHLQKLTLNSRGAAFGFQPSPGQHLFNRPDIRTPLRNLYLAGAWSRYGLGVEGAVTNGLLVARDILGQSGRTESGRGAAQDEAQETDADPFGASIPRGSG